MTMEPYGYDGNNPINSTDPLGLFSWKHAFHVAALVTGAAAATVAVVVLSPVAVPVAVVTAGEFLGATSVGFAIGETDLRRMS